MTYRNKLLLKRLLIVLAILAAAAALALLIGFLYMGRYVVYTEQGAYFSMNAPETAETARAAAPAPSSIELVTGEPISAVEVIGESVTDLEDTEVQGIFLDYETLREGATLDKLELSAEGVNTLMLEMRIAGAELLNTGTVQRLITRAKAQDLHLIAVLSCLGDSSYAVAHMDQALTISGGALWMSSAGTYWLDPGSDAVIDYVAELVRQLSDMGFDEVVLNDFSMPVSDSIVYDYGGKSSEDITLLAYRRLSEAVMDVCRLGLLVANPAEGHQAFDAAEHVYVCYSSGSAVKEYVENHPGKYLVFLTDSHDTRFNDFGKLEILAGPVTSVSTGAIVQEATDEQYAAGGEEPEAEPGDDEAEAYEEDGGEDEEYEDYEDYEDYDYGETEEWE